ncbi:MAG: SRPBCC family protein [Haloferacaceae archaeon]
MREVEVDRFVEAAPAVVGDRLTPSTVVECEGSFAVREVSAAEAGTLVAAGRAGVELLLRFERREDGLAYEQVEGPLDALSTTITYAPEDHGTRLTAHSAVGVRGPAVLDRVAAWKRRGELRRALGGIEARC